MKPVYFVKGPDEQGEEVLLEVFKTEKEAEEWLGTGLIKTSLDRLHKLKPGGTFSLLITRGLDDIRMSGSYAITNPGDLRETKEWRIERMAVVAGMEVDE